MTTEDANRRAGVTGQLLKELLTTRERYVRAWQVHGDRQRGEINQRAVAKVLALYMWDEGIRSDMDAELPSRLKNMVSRAFRGSRLTATSLQQFIRAFDMDDVDQQALWKAFTGDRSIAHTIESPREMARRQWHRTVALFERYTVGPTQRLERRRTVQCIEAREDGVHSYLYNHEPSATRIEVQHGGRIGIHHEYGEGLVADDIVLTHPLRVGERASLEYLTYYADGQAVNEVRRPVRGRTTNVVLELHFAGSELPAQVCFATWSDHFEGDPLSTQALELPDHGQVTFCLPYVEQAVVGFLWQW